MPHILLGNTPSIEKIRELISMVSDTDFNVLILGETGTGKEVVARLLHNASKRRKNAFIKINCSALPLTLLESELFGYEKGAFTGAIKSKPGKFELASNGVIFLDEIGDMPLALQAKLLQVIQSGDFTRLGGTEDVKVNSWVISATNHDLIKDMKDLKFREDLYYRLNIIKIEIPPLRERKEDIPLLTEYFIRKFQSQYAFSEHFSMQNGLQKHFQLYHWPGNVRELSSIILRLMIGEDNERIKTEMMKNMVADGHTPIDGYSMQTPLTKQPNEPANDKKGAIGSLKVLKAEASDYIEKKAIIHALNISGWNKRKAARILNVSYKALFYKIDHLGIAKTI